MIVRIKIESDDQFTTEDLDPIATRRRLDESLPKPKLPIASVPRLYTLAHQWQCFSYVLEAAAM